MKSLEPLLMLLFAILVVGCSDDDDSYATYNEQLLGKWFLTQVVQNGNTVDADACVSQTFLNFVNLEDIITHSYGRDINDNCNNSGAETYKYAVSENRQLVIFDDVEAFNIFDINTLTDTQLSLEDSDNGIQLIFQK